MSKKFISVLSVLLVFTVCVVPMASAAITASDYLLTYSSRIQSGGNGKVVISIIASGKAGVNEIGAKTIVIEESRDGRTWTELDPLTCDDYDEMMVYGARTIGSSVTYYGRSNYYYRATVTYYAGISGTGETREYNVPSTRVS